METLPVPSIDDEGGTKRRASSEEWKSNKKRAVSSTSGSPAPVNGVRDLGGAGSSVDPEGEADLEVCACLYIKA